MKRHTRTVHAAITSPGVYEILVWSSSPGEVVEINVWVDRE
jgi:hypothetical protein